MWRPASRLLFLGVRNEVCAKVPSSSLWVRATSAATGVTSGSVPVWLPGCRSLTQPSAVPHQPLHTTVTSMAASDVQHPSTAVVEAELDRLYSCVEVECRGHEPAVLRSYHKFVSTAAAHLDIHLQDVEWPKKHFKRWTLLKSVHIHKKHRVQYEARTHFLIMRFARLTGSTADTFLEYIQRNLPEGVAMKVTTHELQKLPQHVKPSSEVVA